MSKYVGRSILGKLRAEQAAKKGRALTAAQVRRYEAVAAKLERKLVLR